MNECGRDRLHTLLKVSIKNPSWWKECIDVSSEDFDGRIMRGAGQRSWPRAQKIHFHTSTLRSVNAPVNWALESLTVDTLCIVFLTYQVSNDTIFPLYSLGCHLPAAVESTIKSWCHKSIFVNWNTSSGWNTTNQKKTPKPVHLHTPKHHKKSYNTVPQFMKLRRKNTLWKPSSWSPTLPQFMFIKHFLCAKFYSGFYASV